MIRRGLGRDVAWLSAGYIGRSGAYALLTLVLARGLGASRFGELSLFLAAATGIAYLAGSWPFLAIPILEAEGYSIASVLRVAGGIAIAGAGLSAVVVLTLFSSFAAHDVLTLALVAGYGVALLALQAYYAVLQTLRRMSAIALAQTAERLVAVIAIGLIALSATLTVRIAETGLVMAASLVCAVGLGRVLRGLPGPQRIASRPITWQLVARRVGPMVAVTVASYLVAWADVVILAAFRPHREVGVYSLAYQIYTFVLQLGSVWVTASLPRHAQSAAAGARRFDEVLSLDLLRDSTRVWAALAGVGAVVAAAIIVPVFGGGYRASLGPLLLLLGSAALLATYFAIVPVLVALGRARWLAEISVVSAALNIALDLLLVPRYGIWGGAVATAVQTLVATAALVWRAFGARAVAGLIGAAAPVLATTVALCARPHALAAWFAAGAAALVVGALGLKGLLARNAPRGMRPA